MCHDVNEYCFHYVFNSIIHFCMLSMSILSPASARVSGSFNIYVQFLERRRPTRCPATRAPSIKDAALHLPSSSTPKLAINEPSYEYAAIINNLSTRC